MLSLYSFTSDIICDSYFEKNKNVCSLLPSLSPEFGKHSARQAASAVAWLVRIMMESFISWAWWCNQFSSAHYTTVPPCTLPAKSALYSTIEYSCTVQYCGRCTGLCCHQSPVCLASLLVTELRAPNLVQGRSPPPAAAAVRARVPWDRGRALASDTQGTPGLSGERETERESASVPCLRFCFKFNPVLLLINITLLVGIPSARFENVRNALTMLNTYAT